MFLGYRVLQLFLNTICAACNVISPVKYVLYFYISSSRSMCVVYCSQNVVAHSDAREGKWRGNWWMEGVTSTLTPPRQVVYPALLTLMRTPRLPAVDWTDSPADLNGLVRLGGRQNLVSARVSSHFN